MTASVEKTIVTFERLISACREAKEGFRRAAAAVEDDAVRRLLNLYAQQRTRFAEELFHEIYGTNGTRGDTHVDPAGGSLQEPAKSGGSDFELLRECLHSDSKALESYRDALGSRIPTRAHFLVSAQYSLMQKTHDRMQGLLANSATPPVERRVQTYQAAL